MVNINPSEIPARDAERVAYCGSNPDGFFIRHPPVPHALHEYITPDEILFQTIHMGAAVVDSTKWTLVVDGLVERPFALSLEQLRALPRKTITSFHECYGSPIKPPTDNVWRIGNVQWTGVPLSTLLTYTAPHIDARFVWSEGLDRGEFAKVQTDRYQKDMPIEKAWTTEVLIAYEINGQSLSKERGGPVRLIVPGWFGTNSTKWLCRLTLESARATGPFTTTFYNEVNPNSTTGETRPVWAVEPNSLIFQPAAESTVVGPDVEVSGWAWGNDEIVRVEISIDGGHHWTDAVVAERVDFSWQKFSFQLCLLAGSYELIARATSVSGEQQPLQGRRNHVHRVKVLVVNVQ